MKKQKWLKRVLPIILAALLLLSLLPASAAPQVDDALVSAIVSEDISMREEYAKHFICEDGSYIVG